MKAEYNLSKTKARRNPYAKRLKKQITLRLNPDAIEYFKQKPAEKGIADASRNVLPVDGARTKNHSRPSSTSPEAKRHS